MGAEDMSARARATASSAYAYSRDTVDRVVDPATRQRYYDKSVDLAKTRPILTSLILFNLVFSFIPVVFFLSFTVSTLCFALISALCFTFFWVGIGLCVLVPVLFFTVSIGVLAWLWALSAFFASRYIYSLVSTPSSGPQKNGFPSDEGQQDDLDTKLKTEASDYKQ